MYGVRSPRDLGPDGTVLPLSTFYLCADPADVVRAVTGPGGPGEDGDHRSGAGSGSRGSQVCGDSRSWHDPRLRCTPPCRRTTGEVHSWSSCPTPLRSGPSPALDTPIRWVCGVPGVSGHCVLSASYLSAPPPPSRPAVRSSRVRGRRPSTGGTTGVRPETRLRTFKGVGTTRRGPPTQTRALGLTRDLLSPGAQSLPVQPTHTSRRRTAPISSPGPGPDGRNSKVSS